MKKLKVGDYVHVRGWGAIVGIFEIVNIGKNGFLCKNKADPTFYKLFSETSLIKLTKVQKRLIQRYLVFSTSANHMYKKLKASLKGRLSHGLS